MPRPALPSFGPLSCGRIGPEKRWCEPAVARRRTANRSTKRWPTAPAHRLPGADRPRSPGAPSTPAAISSRLAVTRSATRAPPAGNPGYPAPFSWPSRGARPGAACQAIDPFGPTARPIHDGKKKPGERLGPGWKIGTVSGQRGLLFDANFWKSFLAARLNTTVGDPGAITYHQGEHHQLLDHLTSEQPIAVTARGRTVDEWKLLPGRENHFLDCAVLATVAASAAGITAVGAEMAPERQRRRVEVPKPGAQRKTIATRRR